MIAIRLLEERPFDPPRLVEVEHNGAWWPAMQMAWRLCDDTRGWMADVEWSERYEWGLGKHVTMVPPERLRASTQLHGLLTARHVSDMGSPRDA